MDNLRLKVVINGQTFEAEGPVEAVQAGFAEFRNLLRTAEDPQTSPTGPQPDRKTPDSTLLFTPDKAQNTLGLRILPPAERGALRQIADSMLILLLGFRQLLAQEAVPAIALSDALRRSGFSRLSRLSNAFQTLEEAGLAVRTGNGKGTQYRATDPGLQKAQDLIEDLFRRTTLKS